MARTRRDGTPPLALSGFALIGFTLALLTSSTGCGESEPGWQLVWQDEFDGPAGELPDSSRWRFDIGTDWGNAQLEYDTRRPENVSLDGKGHLVITARQEEYQGRHYTSGRINTWKLFAQTRGRFEARLRLPVGQGVWPAFWLLGANFDTVGWPDCGEIDIMEFRGQEPTILHASVHGPGYAGAHACTERSEWPQPLHEDFHVFTLDWEPERITWMLDGTPYRSITPADLPEGSAWVFDHPHFIILNVAVGGHFVGPPDEHTTFPQTMLVDWVRVYGED